MKDFIIIIIFIPSSCIVITVHVVKKSHQATFDASSAEVNLKDFKTDSRPQ